MESLLDTEEVRYIIKKNWVVSFVVFWKLFKFFILPLLVVEIAVFLIFWWSLKWKVFYINLIFVLYSLIVMFIWLLIEWLDNILDVLIITNKRVIAYLQHSFFHRCTTTAYIWKIKDITWERMWFLPNLFDYWKLIIYISDGHKADNIIDFKINYIWKPEVVAEKVLNYINQMKKEEKKSDAEVTERIDRITKENEIFKILDNLKHRVEKEI